MKKKISTIKSAQGKFDRVDGQISLENFRGRIRLRWQLNSKIFSLTIKGGITQSSISLAYAKANEIAADIVFDRFDQSLRKYRYQESRTGENLISTLWETYKHREKHRSAPATQLIWDEVDRVLGQIPLDCFDIEQLEKFVQAYLEIRALSTCHRHMEALQPAIKAKYPWISLKKLLPRQAKKPIEWFTSSEVSEILKAFQEDTFCSPHSSRLHSFYFPYTAFLAYTGCRPEEAIALTWEDIYWGRGRCEISISKTYSKGKLRLYTKNYLNRKIPVSDKVQSIFKCIPHQSPQVFHSPQKAFFDHRNYRRRSWKPILSQLVQQGKISKYLPPYCLRHSYVSNMHYEHNVPFSTIAHLIGDRVETVIRYYTGIKIPNEVPDLY
ncbi:tyrosine-type recombinase/integrase [Roseofilum sp. Belize Diploria]|uniref:tyrosine-type recombinase/integrase n=1 Tax=Roseofilum sp. Belize Diploria TaxID=2821501 RepID=UPI001B00152C|nr:tyrosine-type recombinase/integrase [Roseofilum sp. Belize Diploria]MBP0008044.1 tyrosine-type recombinase/integrase [Roseofilum sp. Belize Diploria]